ncbi:MAG: YqaE/Pmp3 family membrane protein [Deltaproteobacteria bacterium]|nr:YqaE/Pmp3 family membrane protein [Deltaproteobacteria bacterium]
MAKKKAAKKKASKKKKSSVLLIILAIILPFVAVLIKRGFGKDFWINIILCILWIPGIIHALVIVLK